MFQRTIGLYRASFGGLPREIWSLSAVMLINRSGTMVIPFLTIYLTQTLGFSLVQAGYVMSFFGAGSLVGTILGGRLTDRIGQYPVQMGSLFLTGIAFLILMFIKSFWGICAGIFLATVVADAFRPANMAAIAVYSSAKLHTRSVALNRFAINLGFSIGPAVGGFIMAHLGGQWLFIVDGITCIVAGFLFLYIIPRREETKEEEEETETATHPKGKKVYQDKYFMLFVFFQLLVFMAFFQMFNSIPVYFKEGLLLSEDQIGALLAMNGLLIVMIEMPLIYKLEQIANKLRLINLGTFIISAGFFLLLINDTWAGIAVIFMLFLTFGEIISFPFGSSYALSKTNSKNRGRYMAVYGMSFSIAVILSPLIGMQIADHFGFSTLWLFLGGISMISVAGLYWLSEVDGR